MAFEMTFNYQVILPITVAVAVSFGVRKLLLKDSVYTMKLARRGHSIREPLLRQTNAAQDSV